MPVWRLRDAVVSGASDHWDLFCRVVDNLGDVGIAWRLARQLARDPARSVRLVVDGLAVLARLEPRIDARRTCQSVDGIVVVDRAWPGEAGGPRAAWTVVEVLGCGLPAACLDAMEDAACHPVWIDFEHLSAEAWVADFHGLPSPHPRRALVKHFFYPGFGPRTGGLWLEPGLAGRRRAFVDDGSAVDALWRRLGVPPRAPDECRASLFAYPSAPVGALSRAMADDRRRRWTLLVPEGGGTTATAALAGGSSPVSCDGAFMVRSIPFVDQDDYDRLLWACDLNFVRGEDSFVRAQAAARPFVWQIYRQADDVHLGKLAAFADRYEAGLALACRDAQRRMWNAWNGDGRLLSAAFGAFHDHLPALHEHAERWGDRLGCETPLVDRLIAFAAARRQGDLLD